MRSKAACFDKLRSYLDEVPLVDCHDHNQENVHRYNDPIDVVANLVEYFRQDLVSASSLRDVERITDAKLSIEERWPLLEEVWKRTCHTGYAQVIRRVLAKFYRLEELTLAGLKSMEGRLPDLRDKAVYEGILEEANIAVRLEDVGAFVSQMLDGTFEVWPRNRLVLRFTDYHTVRDDAGIQAVGKLVGEPVTSLEQYVDCCRRIFMGVKQFGAVALKDNSAYWRTLDYGNPSQAEAETVFNWIVEDPRRSAAYPDGTRALDDYLFHAFVRIARDLELPVQIHTGHLAHHYNDITKANAAGLTKAIELHRDVQFDLFHANWPYSGDVLFLAKSYPNVRIDFCWANIIDPVYCQRMFMQALSSVPHTKIHAYGSDFGGLLVQHAWAHAAIARDNLAIALSEMVEMEYLGLDDAKNVAGAWLFDNANAFFRLGL